MIQDSTKLYKVYYILIATLSLKTHKFEQLIPSFTTNSLCLVHVMNHMPIHYQPKSIWDGSRSKETVQTHSWSKLLKMTPVSCSFQSCTQCLFINVHKFPLDIIFTCIQSKSLYVFHNESDHISQVLHVMSTCESKHFYSKLFLEVTKSLSWYLPQRVDLNSDTQPESLYNTSICTVSIHL